MPFDVQTGQLRELASLLDRAKEDIDQTKNFLNKVTEFTGGGGILNNLVDGHRQSYQALSDWLGKLADPGVTGTAQAVRASATYYERTDRASAEKLDGTYPEVNPTEVREHTGYVEIEPPEGTGWFADVTEPTKHLIDPGDYVDELNGSLEWWDTFSPMARVGDAIETVSQVAVWLGWLENRFDPQAELVRPFVGDWSGFRAAADVFTAVGHSLQASGTNIEWASQSVEQVWHGNAGNGAAVYLMNFARPFDEAWQPISELAAAYTKASGELVLLRDVAVNTINLIGDAAIQAAFAAAVGGGAASTGIGIPVGGLAALVAGNAIRTVVNGIVKLCEIRGQLDLLEKSIRSLQGRFGVIGGGGMLPILMHPIDVPR